MTTFLTWGKLYLMSNDNEPVPYRLTDKGHGILDRNPKRCSWCDTLYLTESQATVCERHHSITEP